MDHAASRASFGIIMVLLLAAGEVRAQTVDVGGRAFFDYFYTLSSPDDDLDGFHGFTYRRLYLTTDVALSDDFSARARLEANDGTTGSKGPVPFVKDLWLRWNYAEGHRAAIGVMPPPAFQVSEDVWGYRSLEKTILDFQGVNASRDFGVRLDGRITSDGRLSYAVMYANNSASKPETDEYKRGYAQVAYQPTETLVFSVGADHAAYGDARDDATRVSAFGGYRSEAFRAGIEAYAYRVDFTLDFPGPAEFVHRGVSLFGALDVSPQWELVGRLDVADEELAVGDLRETFVVLGAAYAADESVRIIPNIWMFYSDEDGDPETLARLTVDVAF